MASRTATRRPSRAQAASTLSTRRPSAAKAKPVVSDIPEHASPDDVADFAAGLSEKFLFCREMGHNWKQWTAGWFRDGSCERILRCTRCRTERHQELSNAGIPLKNKYVHPEGYLSHGLGRITGDGRGMLRLESIRRMAGNTKLKAV